MTEEEERERIDRCMRDNPDLPEQFIIDTLKAMDEMKAGKAVPYRFGFDGDDADADADDEESDSET